MRYDRNGEQGPSTSMKEAECKQIFEEMEMGETTADDMENNDEVAVVENDPEGGKDGDEDGDGIKLIGWRMLILDIFQSIKRSSQKRAEIS